MNRAERDSGAICQGWLRAVEGQKMKLRNVTRVSGVGKIVSEQYLATQESPEVLMLRVDAKKRP